MHGQTRFGAFIISLSFKDFLNPSKAHPVFDKLPGKAYPSSASSPYCRRYQQDGTERQADGRQQSEQP